MASADPYDVLGLARDASHEDIQKAYRRLAKKFHPDLNPGDKEAQRKFQDLSAAYDILGDETKRARFDRGEIDASGAEPPQRRYYRDFAQEGAGSQRYESASGFADFTDADDILSAFFSRGGRRRMRGDDRHYRLDVDFLKAVNGGSRRILLPDGWSRRDPASGGSDPRPAPRVARRCLDRVRPDILDRPRPKVRSG
jgi:DnaJ-class molecular chaperone